MNTVEIRRLIFSAIMQKKWLSIDYKNKENNVTHYWIGIRSIDTKRQSLQVDGFHIGKQTIEVYNTILIDSIISAHIIDESYYEVSKELTNLLTENPEQFTSFYKPIPNLKILDYLKEATLLNTTPYKDDYFLLEHFDGDSFIDEAYSLSNEQFSSLVHGFQGKVKNKAVKKITKYLCLNILSVHTKNGLYLLAYKKLLLDVKNRSLVADSKPVICKKFKIGNKKEDSIARFLDQDDFYLLDDFESNLEVIKDIITTNIQHTKDKVDDRPYILPLSRDIPIDLTNEYAFINREIEKGTAEDPIKAFFGEFVKIPVRRKNYPIALLSKNVNIDQLVAIQNAMMYPLTYVQGPPGTGKTTTIINTVLTAFFNEKTVLFSSFNNHPIDSFCSSLSSYKYKDKKIYFPFFRIGNVEKIIESLNYWKKIYLEIKETPIYPDTLKRNKDAETIQTEKLVKLLKKYEDKIKLKERKEAIEKLLEKNNNMVYRFTLEGHHLENIKKDLQEIGEVKNEDVLALIQTDFETLLKYFYYTSIKHIKRLKDEKNKDLLSIILDEDDDTEERLRKFNLFLSNEENIERFLNIFPIIASTCISAGKIGTPKTYFDMSIIDEASQCDSAFALLPILRGKQLMLVGDPQQLNPVILLDPNDNEILKATYKVRDEYDFIKKSIYKVYLALDSISTEILLSRHYRCAPKIIEFNNQKYYNSKLKIESIIAETEPLYFNNIEENISSEKNIAPKEAEAILEYARENPNQNIGVITPFVKQQKLIREYIESEGLRNIHCGTVHAFQGDEKDVILFSLAVTNKTHAKTYQWLKENREIINVATSRAKSKLIVVSSDKEINRLHHELLALSANKTKNETDDIYELKEYVQSKGSFKTTPNTTNSRALGAKPFSSETEEDFLETLNHALDNITDSFNKCSIQKEVPISAVFEKLGHESDFFYKGRFDFVVYKRNYAKENLPVFIIELDGTEHLEDPLVIKRDTQKNAICKKHNIQLIRVPNSYARRYNYVKEILGELFSRGK